MLFIDTYSEGHISILPWKWHTASYASAVAVYDKRVESSALAGDVVVLFFIDTKLMQTDRNISCSGRILHEFQKSKLFSFLITLFLNKIFSEWIL